NGGTSWLAIPAVSDSNALYLTNSASNKIRFEPSGTFYSNPLPDPTITIRAADQSQHYTNGNLINAYGAAASDSGSGSQNLNSFSDATSTLNIHVQALNGTVYVNSNWAGSGQDQSVTDSEGFTHSFGIDAFATISDALSFVATSGTVNVDGG